MKSEPTLIDGTPLFDRTDRTEEALVRIELGRAFRCECREFAPMCVLDGYAVRHRQVIGVFEIKIRSKPRGGPGLLPWRTWDDLQRFSRAFQVPALFVIGWADGIDYIDHRAVDTSRHREGGNPRFGVAHEPLILIPPTHLHHLEELKP